MFEVSPDTKIEMGLKGNVLKGRIEFSDKKELVLDNVDSINTLLNSIYDKEGKNLGDLIREGRVVINSSKLWEKYNVVDGKYFAKILTKDSTPKATIIPKPEKKVIDKEESASTAHVEPEPEVIATEEPVPPTSIVPEPEPKVTETKESEEKTGDDGAIDIATSEDVKKKTKSSKIRFRKFGVAAISVLAAGVVLVTAIPIARRLSNAAKEKENNRGYDNNRPKIETIQLESGASEEVVYAPEENYNDPEYGNSTQYGYEPSDASLTDRYEELGCATGYDDINTQMQVVQDFCYPNESAAFENIVVERDMDAIKIVSDMRNRVLSGNCSASEFEDNVIKYIFERSQSFDGKSIKSYSSLTPFARYIVTTCGQILLPVDYHNGSYDFDNTESLYEYEYNELCGILLEGKKRTH